MIEGLAQDEFVFAAAERVEVDSDRLDVDVTVLSRRLPRARSVKVPDRQLCQIQECIPVGCVPSAAVAVPGGEGVCPVGGCLPRGCLPGEGVSAKHLPVDRMTDWCKNITLLQHVADGN